MSQIQFDVENVLSKIKFTRLYQRVIRSWPDLREIAEHKGLTDEKRDILKDEVLKDARFAVLVGLSAGALSKNYLYDDWIFSYIPDLLAIQSAKGVEVVKLRREFWDKLDGDERKMFEQHVIGAKNYEGKIVILKRIFNFAIPWNQADFDWDEPKVPIQGPSVNWPLSDYVQTEIKAEFIGTTWAMYMNQSLGVQKYIVRISEETDANGLYKIFILRNFSRQSGFVPEDVEYEGVLLADNKQETKKIVAILKDSSNRYAHLILFTGDLPRNQRRTLSMGHFTYFANRPNVNKYLTKTIILDICEDEVCTFDRIIYSESLTENEKLFIWYLSDRKQNRLSSTTDHLYSLKGLREWLDTRYRAEIGEQQSFDSLKSFCGHFYVFFVKKHPLEAMGAVNQFDFIKDRLDIEVGDSSKHLTAKFTHVSTIGKKGSVYQGELLLWRDLFHGHLFSASTGPLYITFRTNKGIYQEGNQCFVGLIAGERDGSNSSVSYTCVVCPSFVIDEDTNGEAEKVIELYLKREALQGWAVVDPSTGKSNKFKISSLTSREDERKFEPEI